MINVGKLYIYNRIVRLRRKINQFISISALKLSGADIRGRVKVFGRFTVIGPGENIVIGAGTSINEGVFLNARDKIIIGERVHLSPYAQVHTGGLDIDSRDRAHTQAPIIIEDNVWIASGAVIVKGVRIGRYSVVGANSVVVSDVPEFTVVAGNPACVLRVISNLEGKDV